MSPLWLYDENGNYYGEHATAYPAPEHIVENLRASLPKGHRMKDIPPLSPDYYHVPEGGTGPVAKPEIQLDLSKTKAEADEADAIVVKGVPPGATVSVSGPTVAGNFTADGSDLHLVFQEPGEHRVAVRSPGHLPHVVRVHVDPAKSTHATRLRRRRKLPKEDTKGATEVLIGTPPEASLEEAERAVDLHFDQVASIHQRHLPMLPEARALLDGHGSARIEDLAKAQGSSPELVAHSIVESADAYWAAHVQRAAARKALRGVAKGGGRHPEIIEEMRKRGISPPAPAGIVGVPTNPTSERA